jgi:hypothetical protein
VLEQLQLLGELYGHETHDAVSAMALVTGPVNYIYILCNIQYFALPGRIQRRTLFEENKTRNRPFFFYIGTVLL